MPQFTHSQFQQEASISPNASFEEETVRLNIWDTTGQEKYKCLCPLYFRDADAALLLFDMTNV